MTGSISILSGATYACLAKSGTQCSYYLAGGLKIMSCAEVSWTLHRVILEIPTSQ